MSDSLNPEDYYANVKMHMNTDTGAVWPDALDMMCLEQALSAKRLRQAQGLDGPPAPLPPTEIDTAPFAKRCFITATVWPPGWPHRVRLLAVRARDLPEEVRDRLRAEGCGPWVDEDNEDIPLGEEMALGLPQGTIPVKEIVTRLKATPTPAERRERRTKRG